MKRIATMVLCTAIGLSLAACGKGGDGGEAGGKAEAGGEGNQNPLVFVPSKANSYIAEPFSKTIDSNDYTCYLNPDGTILIYRYDGDAESVVIPDEIDGRAVTAINKAAFVFQRLSGPKEITIPKSVTTVYANPFCECWPLETIHVAEGNTAFAVMDNCLVQLDGMVLVAFPRRGGEFHIPDGIRKIGDWAFADNHSFSSIDIPDGITEIGDYAFIRSGLSSVKFPRTLQSIGDWGFAHCDIFGLDLPQGLKSIGEGAFATSYIKELVLPDGLESLGAKAFENSAALASVRLPASLKKTGEQGNPFDRCPKLANLTVAPENAVLKMVGPCLVNNDGHALVCCLNATEVAVPDGVERISAWAFQEMKSLESVKLPAGLKEIGEEAFKDCRKLVSVNFPDGLKTIGSWAFYNDESLTGIRLPDSLETLGERAFGSCKTITEANIPGGVKTVGRGTFESCYKLAKVTVGNGVESIGEGAFGYCDSLTDITLPASLTNLHDDAFRRSDGVVARVPKKSYAEEFCKKNNINFQTNN